MKRKFISLLLAVTLTASFTGCGKEEVQDSSSNVKEETEKVDSQNNQTENDVVESDIIMNESFEGNNGESNPMEETDSTDIDEEQIINERMEQWFDDLDWDATEEEKEALYQEFCAERIPSVDYTGYLKLNRSIYYWDGSQDYLWLSEELEYNLIPIPEYAYIYGFEDSYVLVCGTLENELYYMEYDGTLHFIKEFDEAIDWVRAQKEYCFLITESGVVYRVHYVSGRVDFVTTLYPGAGFDIYDSQGILYYDKPVEDDIYTEEDGKTGWGPYEGNYFDMATGQCEEPPADALRVVEPFEYSEDTLKREAIYEEFCSNRVRYVPDNEKARFFEYEIDENGNLIKWHKVEGRESAKAIESETYSLMIWNEYIYYMEGGTVKFRIDGIPADALVQLGGYGESIQIYGNDEYLFLVIDGVVDFYHIPSEKGESNVADIGIDSTNFRIYDNRSFLWNDVNGNTHYYDMDLDSEQPVPEDAVGM